MAKVATDFAMRDLTKGMTMEITVHQPIHHRLLFWCGMQCFRAGARLMGLGGIAMQIDEDAA